METLISEVDTSKLDVLVLLVEVEEGILDVEELKLVVGGCVSSGSIDNVN